MEIRSINKAGFDRLIKREEESRDASPEHTLDWYTYNNRIALLKEVEDLLLPNDIKLPKEEKRKKVEKPAPEAGDKPVI